MEVQIFPREGAFFFGGGFAWDQILIIGLQLKRWVCVGNANSANDVTFVWLCNPALELLYSNKLEDLCTNWKKMFRVRYRSEGEHEEITSHVFCGDDAAN